METLIDSIVNNSTTPLLTAIMLGIINAVGHCKFGSNLASICYISKDIDNKHAVFINGLYFVLGRIFAYITLAVILLKIIRKSIKIDYIQEIFAHYGSHLTGPLLLLVGIILLYSSKIHSHQGEAINKQIDKHASKGRWGAFLLGLLLTLAFCPVSAFIFFGIIIPLASSSSEGLLIPITFAIATASPIIIASYAIAYSFHKINHLSQKMDKIGNWSRIIVSVLFILLGLYFIFFHHHHHTLSSISKCNFWI